MAARGVGGRAASFGLADSMAVMTARMSSRPVQARVVLVRRGYRSMVASMVSLRAGRMVAELAGRLLSVGTGGPKPFRPGRGCGWVSVPTAHQMGPGDTPRVSPRTGSVRRSAAEACVARRQARDATAVSVSARLGWPGFRVGCSPHRGGEQPFTLGAASELYRRLYGQSAARHSAGVWSARFTAGWFPE